MNVLEVGQGGSGHLELRGDEDCVTVSLFTFHCVTVFYNLLFTVSLFTFTSNFSFSQNFFPLPIEGKLFERKIEEQNKYLIWKQNWKKEVESRVITAL